MDRSIRVTTEKVKSKGEELSGMADQIKRHLQSVEDEIGKIEGCFQAQAAGQLRKAFGTYAAEGLERVWELAAHIEKLQEIAAIYEEAERENELVTAVD